MQKTWSWSVYEGIFGNRTHEEIHEICRSAGLDGIEGSYQTVDGASDSEIEVIGAAYRAADVKIETFHLPFNAEDDLASFYEQVRKRAVDTAKAWMEKSARLGSKIGIQHPSTSRCGVEDEGLDPFLRQLGKSLESLLPIAESLNYTLALENMLPGECTRFGSKPEHFERIKREFEHPHLGFCLDTGHALCSMGPERAGEVFDVMASPIAAFHLADNAGDRDSHLAPGHGSVNWTAVFRKAAEIRFSGVMCIEAPPFAPGPDYSIEAYRQMVVDTETLVEKALGG